MSKEQEIQEITRTLCEYNNVCDKECYERDCFWVGVATCLYTAGYRKADEVRKETAREFIGMLRELRGLNHITTHITFANIIESVELKYGVEVEEQDFDTWLENQPEGTYVQGGGIDMEEIDE